MHIFIITNAAVTSETKCIWYSHECLHGKFSPDLTTIFATWDFLSYLIVWETRNHGCSPNKPLTEKKNLNSM